MVKRALAKAAETIAGLKSIGKAKFEERRLIIVFTDKKKGTCILGAKDASRFKIEKGKKAIPATVTILRTALPAFNQIMNVDDVTRCNREHFISNHVEYEVVRVDFSNTLGTRGAVNALKCLEEHGFVIIPLADHPHRKKLEPIVGRP